MFIQSARFVDEHVRGLDGRLGRPVTGWLEQDYTLEGQRQHISAPSSVVFRRGDRGWQIIFFHSIPLPEGSPSS